jgi:hypothetical protein
MQMARIVSSGRVVGDGDVGKELLSIQQWPVICPQPFELLSAQSDHAQVGSNREAVS